MHRCDQEVVLEAIDSLRDELLALRSKVERGERLSAAEEGTLATLCGLSWAACRQASSAESRRRSEDMAECPPAVAGRVH